MPALSLKLELLYFSEEYQQALDTGWEKKKKNIYIYTHIDASTWSEQYPHF